MVTYLYRCPEHHETSLAAPMGEAPAHTDCACGHPARKSFTAPMVRAVPRIRERLHEASEQCTEQPALTTIPAPAPAPPPPADPRHAQLPRA